MNTLNATTQTPTKAVEREAAEKKWTHKGENHVDGEDEEGKEETQAGVRDRYERETNRLEEEVVEAVRHLEEEGRLSVGSSTATVRAFFDGDGVIPAPPGVDAESGDDDVAKEEETNEGGDKVLVDEDEGGVLLHDEHLRRKRERVSSQSTTNAPPSNQTRREDRRVLTLPARVAI